MEHSQSFRQVNRHPSVGSEFTAGLDREIRQILEIPTTMEDRHGSHGFDMSDQAWSTARRMNTTSGSPGGQFASRATSTKPCRAYSPGR